MTRIRSLPISVATTLVVVVAWRPVAATPNRCLRLSHDDGAWQSRRPTDRDDSLQGNSWRRRPATAVRVASPEPPSESVWRRCLATGRVGQRGAPSCGPAAPSSVPATPPAKQTRWIAPTAPAQDLTHSVGGHHGESRRASAANDYPDAQSAGTHEPQQFVPPINAARLRPLRRRGNNESAVRSTQSESAAVNSADRPTNQSARSRSDSRVDQRTHPIPSAAQPAVKGEFRTRQPFN